MDTTSFPPLALPAPHPVSPVPPPLPASAVFPLTTLQDPTASTASPTAQSAQTPQLARPATPDTPSATPFAPPVLRTVSPAPTPHIVPFVALTILSPQDSALPASHPALPASPPLTASPASPTITSHLDPALTVLLTA